MSKNFLGIDIGGTKAALSIGTLSGKILYKKIYKMYAKIPPKVFLKNVFSDFSLEAEKRGLLVKKVFAVGIACPGPFDPKKGRTIFIPNIKGWEHFPIKRAIERLTKKRTFMENDANLAALGEKVYGKYRKLDNFVYITVSTGIGGGVIINGDIYNGKSYDAGEIGHMVIDPAGPKCGCGKRGCLEAFASGSAIAKLGEDLAKTTKKGLLYKIYKQNGKITTSDVIYAVKKRDKIAKIFWDSTVNYLAIGITNIVHVLNPEAIIIGGGVSKVGKILFEPLRLKVKKYAWPRIYGVCKIVPASLGANVVDYGAYALCAKKLKLK